LRGREGIGIRAPLRLCRGDGAQADAVAIALDPLGLLAFFYAAVHFGTDAAIEEGLLLRAVMEEIGKRKFMRVGFAARFFLLPRAAMPFSSAIQGLGFERRKRLHGLFPLPGTLGAIRVFLRGKREIAASAAQA
jgi:sulfoxide reductase heme-binding subunit YedZ